MICRFCQDRGCLCCAGERLRHQQRVQAQAPELPEPLFVAKLDNPSDVALFEEHFGPAALDSMSDVANGDRSEFIRQVILSAFRAKEKQAQANTSTGSE
jgi:hypothetical protein